jgi:DNA end-binding protein Ku
MKATWQGYIALGQLGIPARLYSASRSIRPQFVQLHEKDSSPVERVLKCSSENHEISYKEIVRAVEYEPGRYITLTGQELERNLPASTKTIEVKQFCDLTEIDPIYFEKPYYIAPTRGGDVGIIALYRDLLVLHQLRFAEEIVPRNELKSRSLPRPSPTEVNTLQSVIEHFSGPFYIEDYHDDYAEQVQTLIERKVKGLPPPRRESISANATPEEEIVTALQSTLSKSHQLATSAD